MNAKTAIRLRSLLAVSFAIMAFIFFSHSLIRWLCLKASATVIVSSFGEVLIRDRTTKTF